MRGDPAQYIQRISKSLLTLPTLPTLAARLLELVDNPRASAGMLAQLIGQDQVLTARLLKMCNSAYYGLGREVTSIHQAIVLLGFDNVKEISLGVSVIHVFKATRGSDLFDITAFWDHCAAVGIVSRRLARKFCPSLASEAFTAGLLHDIGKVVLLQYLAEEFGSVLQEARESGRELFAVEKERLGVHHGEVGAWLATRWKLPPNLVEAMRFHHEVEAAPGKKDLVTIVHLANIFCRLLRAGSGGNFASPRFSEEVRDLAGGWGLVFQEEVLRSLLQDLAEEVEQGSTIRSDLLA